MVTMTVRVSAALTVCVALLLGACRQAPADPAAAPADATPPIAARFACDEVAVAATFHGDRVELQLPGRTLTLPQVIAASGARFSDGSNTFWNKGNDATFELDGRTQSCRQVRDPWLDAAGRGIDFRAVGQEPGWYLEIDNERSIHLVYDYAERTATTPVPAPVVKGAEMSYTAVTDAHRLAVLIEPRLCSDTMSGQRFPRTVTVTIDGQMLRGCGRSLTAPDSRWRVTARGLGPVRVGMTMAEAGAALGMPLAGADAAGECIYVRPSRELAGVMFMVVNGAIARVDVSAGDVATEEGVRVGDSSESVRELYAGRVTASPHKYTDGEYLTISPDAQHRIVFEVERQQVTRYRGGRLPEVEWVEGCS
jgi:membrane-bound inhibitor of C-type lysozyme/uncharacterized membrane protein